MQDELSDEEVLEMFERVADFMRAGMAAYDAIPQQMEAYEDYVQSPREFYFWMLTLEVGKTTAQANLTWLECIIQRIKDGEIPRD